VRSRCESGISSDIKLAEQLGLAFLEFLEVDVVGVKAFVQLGELLQHLRLGRSGTIVRIGGGSLCGALLLAEELAEFLKGPTGIVFTYEDPVAPAKIIKKFYDKSEKPKLKVALVEDKVYDRKKLNELASLLSKPEIISAIVGSLNAPISGIVGSINAVIRDLASTIEEVAKKQAN
jgi:hypothetical protein